MRTFYEFFAGGGMARQGLGEQWKCLFANDFDPKKVLSYKENWGSREISLKDVSDLRTSDLPGYADLVWASFPCQDLSLAGGGAGLRGERSGTFWPFWRQIENLIADGRKPRFVALENVTGMLSSHRGKDFQAICRALSASGYRFGAIVVDAAHFIPHSRKRVFVIGVSKDVLVEPTLTCESAHPVWHPASLQTAMGRLDSDLQQDWIWWSLPDVEPRASRFIDIYENDPTDVPWHSVEETTKLLGMMSDRNRQKLQMAERSGEAAVGTLYKRTRPSPAGGIQRAEIRLDGTAGCLRTPGGGSSRQVVVRSDKSGIRSRLISMREAARLMGLPEDYRLPANYNDAYHLLGDGLAVPAVSFVATNLLTPLATQKLAKAA